MPICGFNEKMLEGLKEFHKGLVKQTAFKESKKSKLKLEEEKNGFLRI